MFDVVATSNFPTEPPLELIAPEDLVDELASEFATRERVEARIAVLLARASESMAFERDGFLLVDRPADPSDVPSSR
jgi:hypothetical protein